MERRVLSFRACGEGTVVYVLDGADETVRNGATGPDTKHGSTESRYVERDVQCTSCYTSTPDWKIQCQRVSAFSSDEEEMDAIYLQVPRRANLPLYVDAPTPRPHEGRSDAELVGQSPGSIFPRPPSHFDEAACFPC